MVCDGCSMVFALELFFFSPNVTEKASSICKMYEIKESEKFQIASTVACFIFIGHKTFSR